MPIRTVTQFVLGRQITVTGDVRVHYQDLNRAQQIRVNAINDPRGIRQELLKLITEGEDTTEKLQARMPGTPYNAMLRYLRQLCNEKLLRRTAKSVGYARIHVYTLPGEKE